MTTISVTINNTMLIELKRAAQETGCHVGRQSMPSHEQYAAEIIESYLASRRLTRIVEGERFIDEATKIVDEVMGL